MAGIIKSGKKYQINYSKEGLTEAKERLRLAFEHRVSNRVPFIFTVEGYPQPENVGFKDLAIDHKKALEYQVEVCNFQFKSFPDCDRIPYFDMGDTGQGVIPSMFGAKQLVTDKQRPFTQGRIIKDLERDLPSLPLRVNPYEDGWGPHCLQRLKFFLEATEGEVSCQVLDHQSSFGLASKLIDPTQLMIEMYDHPELIKRLLDIITAAIIDTIDAQKEVARKVVGDNKLLIGSNWQPNFYNHMIIWDDYVSVINPHQYSNFCKEYNEKIFEKFGEGHLHTCGPILDSPLEVMLATRGCKSIDLTTLRGSTRTRRDLLDLKQKILGKCVLVGSLAEIDVVSPSVEEYRLGKEKIDLELVREMNRQGGFIWVESGSLEEGKKFLEMAKNAVCNF